MKSCVSMEKKTCVVCGKEYETNAILLDKRLRDSMGRYTNTGGGLCDEHQKLYDEGYIALVGLDPNHKPEKDTVNLEDGVYVSGKIAHVRTEVLPKILNIEIPDSPMVYVDDEVMDYLETLANYNNEEDQNGV